MITKAPFALSRVLKNTHSEDLGEIPCVAPTIAPRIGSKFVCLGHLNRSDLSDLRLRCPARTPEITSDFRDFALRFKSAMEPKGPFRTKNATALNSVVFYYCRSFFTICSDLLLNFPLKIVVSKCLP